MPEKAEDQFAVCQDLAMEVFAIREEIDDSESVSDLMPVQTDMTTRLDDCEQELDGLFDDTATNK